MSFDHEIINNQVADTQQSYTLFVFKGYDEDKDEWVQEKYKHLGIQKQYDTFLESFKSHTEPKIRDEDDRAIIIHDTDRNEIKVIYHTELDDDIYIKTYYPLETVDFTHVEDDQQK